MIAGKGEFKCVPCTFVTTDRRDWKRHTSSTKHQLTAYPGEVACHTCCACGKRYKHASGVSRHRKACTASVIRAQAKHIEELQGIVHELAETNRRTVEALQPAMGNVYNTTNKMTVNVFLNEQCKGAMNLTDFVDSMVISVSDLDYTRENGYVKGISNIFAKHLDDLGPTERPIHCVDGKRLQFYVKDEGEWNRDENEKMSESIHQVSSKQIQQIKAWERANPNWEQNERGVEEYLATIRGVMGGSDGLTGGRTVEDIKRHLGANVQLRSSDICVVGGNT